jgi:hypothetical protein
MSTKPMSYIGIIKGRPIDLQEEAPSWKNELLKRAAREYYVNQIVPHLQYLISEVPVSQRFWANSNYSDLEFEYKGSKVILLTNHGSEECMREVIRGKLDISDWILDLSHLLGIAMAGRTQREEFLKEIRERTQNGIEKYLID